jgi:hypothetical protein
MSDRTGVAEKRERAREQAIAIRPQISTSHISTIGTFPSMREGIRYENVVGSIPT